MSRRFIREGDKTDRNGVVVDGIAGTSLQGQPFAYLGAPVQCPACGTTGVIISDGSPRAMTMMGKQVALENDLCQCKCEPLPKLISSQALGSIKTLRRVAACCRATGAVVETYQPRARCRSR